MLITVILVMVFCSVALAAEFNADLAISGMKKDLKAKIYVKDTVYTLALSEQGMEILILASHDSEGMWMLVPSLSQYKKLDGFAGAFVNPVKGWEKFTEKCEKSQAGIDTVQGYECIKYVYSLAGKTTLEMWVSPKLNHFVKQRSYTQDSIATMELLNIKEGADKNAVFAVPESYTELRPPATQEVYAPQWVKKVPSASLVKIPFEKKMAATDIVRVSLQKGKRVKIEAENQADTNSAFTAIPFQKGKPIKNPGLGTFTLNKGQSVIVTILETIKEADEVVIRIKNGSVLIKATLTDK